ncbi:enoyl-CoA hydratase/carnithine racemase [Neobacillus niacini]|nr:enoyl-CoA hydratase/carnithine racemase [Neobacillus niacini]
MNYQYIKVKNEEGIINITLNRPPYNVLHIPALNELLFAFNGLRKRKGH